MDLIYLAGCAVNSQAPRPERVAEIGKTEDGWANLRAKARQQKMSAMAAIALESMSEEDQERVIPAEERDFWHKERMANLRRRMMFDTEREEIYHFLDEQGIWYVPLKGIIIQDYYPVYEMREMSDNDILFDQTRREDVRKWFEARGYRHESDDNVDAYLKEPFYNYEMHFILFNLGYGRDVRYFSEIDRRSVKNDSSGHLMEKKMPDEDFYLYFLAHANKHANLCGSGIRPVFDHYVIRKEYEGRLDNSSLEKKMVILQIEDFSAALNELSRILVTNPEDIDLSQLHEESWELVSSMLRAGIFGSELERQRIFFHNQARGEKLTRKQKWRYIMLRMFPNREYMQIIYPILEKHPILLPVLYLDRLIKRSIHQREQIKTELKGFNEL
ncbi:MAG: nucleotidyltransferase family protein [Lachnospiraceae bacterium]|nr:nucleotidyltransferase family protein [Lachnospiraceae bacterium]